MRGRLPYLFLSCLSLLPGASRFGMVVQLPGSGADDVVSLARDPQGNLLLFGHTKSPDLPATTLHAKRLGSALYRIDGGAYAPVLTLPNGFAAPTCFATSRYEPATLYGVFSNRLYRTSDSGATWVPLSLPEGIFTCSSLSADYVAPGTLYLQYYRSDAAGTRVARSLDGGLNWSPWDPGGGYVSEIVTPPAQPGVYWALGSNPTRRTTDGGATWHDTPFSFGALAFDPGQRGVAYATGTVNQVTAAWRTNDNGATWTQLGPLNGPEPTFPVLFAPDQRRAGLVYASDYRFVYRSTDSGATWATIAPASNYAAIAVAPRSGRLYLYGQDAILISDDEGTTFQSIPVPLFLPSRRLLLVGDPADSTHPQIFLPGDPERDLFLAKYSPAGQVLWASYLGGSGADSAAAMAVDARGDIYLAGNTSSREFPVTEGAYRPSPPAQTGGFVTKISGDGTRILYSLLLPGAQTIPRAIAADPNGAAWIVGQTGVGPLSPPRNPPAPGTPGALTASIFPPPAPTGFALRVSPLGDTLDVVHQPLAPPFWAAAIDSQGRLFAGGNQLWRFGPNEATRIEGFELGLIRALATGLNNRLYLAGQTSQRQFPTTRGALLGEVPHYSPIVGIGFSAALDTATNGVVYSTFLGGENFETPASLAVDARGNAVVGGATGSRAFPLHTAVQGAFDANTGYIATLSPWGDALVDSTFAGDERPFAVRSVAPAPGGSVYFAGASLRPDLSETEDVFLVRLDPAPAASDLRLDAVLNAASRDASPLAPGAQFTLTGDAFREDSRVTMCGAEAIPLTRNWKEITVAAPASVLNSSACEVTVTSAGATAPPVLMPTAPTSPGIFTVDQLGYDFAVGINEDGTANSAANPARAGQVFTLKVNGVDPALPVTVVTNHPAENQVRIAPISVERGAVRFRLPTALPAFGPLLFSIENGGIPSRQVPIRIVDTPGQ